MQEPPDIINKSAHRPLRKWISRYWFLGALAASMLCGVVFSEQVAPWAADRRIPNALVTVVMFLMAFPLRTRTLLQAVVRPRATLLATFNCFVLVPALAWIASRGLDASNAPGLMVAAATPCTLAMASVLTVRAGGNEAVALMTTILSNASCVIVSPLLIWLMIGAEAEIPVQELATSLGLFVLLPILTGQLLRASPRLAQLGTRWKKALNTVAQSGVVIMVTLGMATTAGKLAGNGLDFAVMVRIGIFCLAIHMIAWVAGFQGGAWLGISRPDRIAAGFAGSQKTLMAGLLICVTLGVSMLPMVTYHMIQLVADTLIADRLAGRPGENGEDAIAT